MNEKAEDYKAFVEELKAVMVKYSNSVTVVEMLGVLEVVKQEVILCKRWVVGK